MIINLVRHGESQTNSGEIPHGFVGDYKIQLTNLGKSQAEKAGRILSDNGFDFENCLLYSSPYKRAIETMSHLLKGANVTHLLSDVREDPRIRELDHGYRDVSDQEDMRKEHGWFYYRFKGGESPADCYDRCCGFIESLMRQVQRKSDNSFIPTRPDILIVMHGMTLRCFVTRWMHLTVDQFETLANPHNGDIVTIGPLKDLKNPQFSLGKWGVEGLRFRDHDEKYA